MHTQKHSIRTRKKMSVSQKKSYTEGRRSVVKYWKGKKLPENIRIKLSIAKRGDKHPNWKGGLKPGIKDQAKMRELRKLVHERDKYTCVLCRKTSKEVRLCVDHIKPFLSNPDLRYVLENCRTLCYPCHYKTDTFGGRMSWTRASRKTTQRLV